MLFHGLHKLFGGVGFISGMLVEKGLPGFIAYGVLIGEVVAPILSIVGLFTRPAALVLAFTMIVAWLMVRREQYFTAFVFSSLMIAGLLISAAVGLFPNMLVSTLNPSYNLTIFNAASQPNTLTVMLVMALIGMPFVLLYTAGVYYIFRGRVQIGPSSY